MQQRRDRARAPLLARLKVLDVPRDRAQRSAAPSSLHRGTRTSHGAGQALNPSPSCWQTACFDCVDNARPCCRACCSCCASSAAKKTRKRRRRARGKPRPLPAPLGQWGQKGIASVPVTAVSRVSHFLAEARLRGPFSSSENRANDWLTNARERGSSPIRLDPECRCVAAFLPGDGSRWPRRC